MFRVSQHSVAGGAPGGPGTPGTGDLASQLGQGKTGGGAPLQGKLSPGGPSGVHGVGRSGEAAEEEASVAVAVEAASTATRIGTR